MDKRNFMQQVVAMRQMGKGMTGINPTFEVDQAEKLWNEIEKRIPEEVRQVNG